jgi:hypothetical protein
MNNRKIPDLMLEQYLLHELKDSDRIVIEELLRRDIQLQARLESIRLSDKVFTNNFRDESFLKNSVKVKSGSGDFTLFKPVFVPVLCTLLLVPPAFILFLKLQSPGISERAKGEITLLTAYRKTGFGHEQLQNGSVVRQSDLIQLEYRVPDTLLFGMIISIDGIGNISIHFGTEDGKPVHLSPRHKMLPFAYQLDDAPEYEKFYLITSTKPFLLNDCITLCKKMDKDLSVTKKFTIRMLAFNKVILSEGP